MNPKILEIDGWMHPIELEWLYNTAQRIPKGSLIVEVGAWKGRSSAALYEGAGKEKTVISIDTWQGQDDLPDHKEALEKDIFKIFLFNMRNLGFDPQPYRPGQLGPQYLIMDAIEASTLFRDQSVDWLFDDGDHRMCGTDIDVWYPKMKPDGLYSGHDYFCFYETIQQEIHKRFYIHQIVYSIWVRYVGQHKPDYL